MLLLCFSMKPPPPFFQPYVVGKPSINFYHEAVDLLKQENGGQEFPPDRTWMIGDDVKDDVLGALDAGFHAILVKTGKYREGDENEIPSDRRLVVDTFVDAVDFLIQKLEEA